MSEPNFIANGTIQPSRFVCIDPTVNKAVTQAADATHFIIGVSQEWSVKAPIPGATSEAANQNDPVKVYTSGDICLLSATSAGWTSGDRLTSDSAGSGVTASGTNYYGAIALSTLTGSALGQVQIITGKNP